MIRTVEPKTDHETYGDDLDIRALGAAVRRKKFWIIIPTLAAILVAGAFVTFVKPRYSAEAQVLLENQENFFTRPERAEIPRDNAVAPDAEGVASQVQLVTSRDLGRRAIAALNLVGNPEFDPLSRGLGSISRVLVLFGLMRDPTRIPAEDRVLETYLERLTVYSPPKTRILTVEFRSADPELAARAANEIVTLYLEMQSEAKRDAAKTAATSLAAQISDLRVKVARAEADAEQFRASNGLLAGTNNMTITGQQLAELNTELSKARTSQADAQAKASLIRDMIRQNRIGDVADVANNDLVRRIAEQRVTAKAQMALESRTLLPGHPRIKELTAQIADFDAQLRAAADKTARALENEAKFASTRVANLEAAIEQQKKSVTLANSDDVRLRELERISQSYRDQLQSNMTKYQEAVGREDSPATPADARIIARAAVPQDPSFPKKMPTLFFGAIAGLVFSLGAVVAGELLSGRNVKPQADPTPPPPPRPRQIFEPLKAFGRSAAAARMAAATTSVPEAKKEPEHPSEQEFIHGVSPEAETLLLASKTEKPQEFIKQNSRKLRLSEEGRGVRIIATSLADDSMAATRLIGFARELAREGRPIVVDIEPHSTKFAALIGDRPRGSLGLTDLVDGKASFAEVIHRDQASRLHFVSFGMARAFEPEEFDLVLDALSQTYDYLLVAAPPLKSSDLAKNLAAHADLVALAAPEKCVEADLVDASEELFAAGATEVVVLDGHFEEVTRVVA
jgi:polysaccharide biosynthesis transport protein